MEDDNSNKTYIKHMNIITAKLLALAGIAIFSFICGLMPYALVKFVHSRCTFRTRILRVITTALICFSGGTLLGVAFLHLMPEMREKIKQLELEGRPLIGTSFIPVGDFLTCIGFFFVYLVDELMHMLVEWYTKKRQRKNIQADNNYETALSSRATSVIDIHPINIFSLDSHRSSFHTNENLGRLKMTKIIKPDDPYTNNAPVPNETDIHFSQNRLEVEESVNEAVSAETEHPKVVAAIGYHQHDPHSTSHYTVTHSSFPALSGLIAIVALSFHDIFEGLAIGIENSCESVSFLFLSVAAHKYSIAFCIGVDLALSKTKLLVIVLYMLTYSLVSPVGVIIGMVVVTGEQPTLSLRNLNFFDTPTSVIVQGLAGGTLIYVVCFEVLQREGSDTHAKGVLHVLCVFCGFLLTLLVKILLRHNEEEMGIEN